MARVAVLHNTLDLRGGADAVCLHVCEALQAGHDVTLFTLGQSSIDDLNRLFGTAADVPVHRPRGSKIISKALERLARWTGPLLPQRSVLLRQAFRQHADAYDLAVSTANEFALSLPSVQYVHFPQFNRQHTSVGSPGRFDPLWSRLAGLPERELPEDATMLANSAWTADVVETIYGRRPAVRHPPVDPIPNAADWEDREPGFVSIGRLAPDNRTLDAIRIVDGVRRCGHDIHLHLVGSDAPAYREYVRRVEQTAATRDHVTVEADVPRERVEHLLATHRYGLNTKPMEHFGMAVAEFVAAGMVTFAPDAGGQREILDEDERFLYDGPEQAVAKIDDAIDAGLRPQFSRDRFTSDRFATHIRTAVEEKRAESE